MTVKLEDVLPVKTSHGVGENTIFIKSMFYLILLK